MALGHPKVLGELLDGEQVRKWFGSGIGTSCGPLIAGRNSGTEFPSPVIFRLVPIIACWRQLLPSRAAYRTFRDI